MVIERQSHRTRGTNMTTAPFSTSALSAHHGMVIERGHLPLTELPHADIADLFKIHGTLLFRGFEASAEDFRGLVQRFSSTLYFHQNPNRETLSDDGAVLLVDAHRNPIPAHAEMSYCPLHPGLQWFFCVQPAGSGGATTVYDGVEAYNRLAKETRDLFDEHRLTWRLPFPTGPEHQERVFGTSDRGELEAMFADYEDFTYEFDESGNLNWNYTVSAVPQAPYVDARTLCNSYLGSGAIVAFEDGSPIPQHCRWDALDATEQVAVDIEWQAGDIVMIDNRRVMHGRRGFEDPNRKVAAMLSRPNF
ncbi:TauD/TfdA family dioxygenase [Streptomyces sp. NBC_00234]|uniref:TauD/TfdA family dioxygenase n=1 Tax=Streptomyces sp. NBC_00234 TaxID=2903638 RepID=UPI002E2C973F|nr:TauD/TfdA family dioxygenase [Streptomyces sp. NBC_00234]